MIDVDMKSAPYQEFLLWLLLDGDFNVRRHVVEKFMGTSGMGIAEEKLIEHLIKPSLSLDSFGRPLMFSGETFKRDRAIRNKRLAILAYILRMATYAYDDNTFLGIAEVERDNLSRELKDWEDNYDLKKQKLFENISRDPEMVLGNEGVDSFL